jgi:hypothetical protein
LVTEDGEWAAERLAAFARFGSTPWTIEDPLTVLRRSLYSITRQQPRRNARTGRETGGRQKGAVNKAVSAGSALH